MKRSTDRILTTHTGSLPRPDDLVRTMWARDEGVPVDARALAERVRAAVREVAALQAQAGVDVINDGEVSKPGFSTYVTSRLTGFDGESEPYPMADLLEYPQMLERMSQDPGRRHRRNPSCTGPVALHDRQAVHTDIANLRAALAAVQHEEGFMTAASPGVIALTMKNRYYPTHEAYLYAVAEAMKAEYHAIVDAGFVLQLDCPDLAMGRQAWFAQAPLEEFRRVVQLHVEAINYAVADLPPERMRLHLCWGNYEGPHHHDVPLRQLVDLVLPARPQGLSIEAANPRHEHEWVVWEEIKLPEGKVLIPGVIDSTNNYIEHPELVAQRILRFARLLGRENVIAGCDCGFGTFVGNARVVPGIVWAKLASLVEGARQASAALWP